MPIYEYRCSSCGHELEVLQKLSEAPLAACPSCSKDALVKLVSAGGFQLKGTGWYATDFKGSGKKPAAKTSERESKSTEAESKSDTKVESKTDSTATKSDSTATKSESKTESKTETKKPTSTAPSSAGS